MPHRVRHDTPLFVILGQAERDPGIHVHSSFFLYGCRIKSGMTPERCWMPHHVRHDFPPTTTSIPCFQLPVTYHPSPFSFSLETSSGSTRGAVEPNRCMVVRLRGVQTHGAVSFTQKEYREQSAAMKILLCAAWSRLLFWL